MVVDTLEADGVVLVDCVTCQMPLTEEMPVVLIASYPTWHTLKLHIYK